MWSRSNRWPRLEPRSKNFGTMWRRLSEEHSALRVELAGLEERRRAEQSARQRLENQIRDIAHRRQQLTHELERLGVEKARLLSDNIELDSRAAELAKHIADGDAVANELAAQEAKGRSELAAADESLRISRQEMQAASDRRSHIELNLVKKQAELKYLEETCNKQLGCTLQEVAEGDETVLDEVGLVEVEQKCQDLTSKIDALGPVNTEALEQFEEAQQRYDFLNAQRQDLLDSIRDTEKTISEIDVEARKRFTEAFELINANFREMFKTLFGGGIGEMRLSDAENAIESGIDIVASPPGKKLQSVLLLSGGERALTAMALLMAIFKYQPSPFCVLDEVDAPLDEANIDRLTRSAEGDVGTDAVHRDHALQAHDGIGAGALRRDDAGARRVEAGFGEIQSAATASGPRDAASVAR